MSKKKNKKKNKTATLLKENVSALREFSLNFDHISSMTNQLCYTQLLADKYAMSHDYNSLIEAEWSIYASVNEVITGLDNGLLPVWHQAIIWTNVGLLLIRPFATNFSEIWIRIQ